jgi:hypothetical protein
MREPIIYQEWTHSEEQFLLDNHGAMSNTDLAEKLKRKVKSVESKVHAMKKSGRIFKHLARYKEAKDEDVELLPKKAKRTRNGYIVVAGAITRHVMI